MFWCWHIAFQNTCTRLHCCQQFMFHASFGNGNLPRPKILECQDIYNSGAHTVMTASPFNCNFFKCLNFVSSVGPESGTYHLLTMRPLASHFSFWSFQFFIHLISHALVQTTLIEHLVYDCVTWCRRGTSIFSVMKAAVTLLGHRFSQRFRELFSEIDLFNVKPVRNWLNKKKKK